MKNFLLNKILSFLAVKLDGKKTYIAGTGLVLLALLGCVGKMWPESGLPDPSWDTIGTQLSAGLAAFGVGHKIEKLSTSSTTLSPNTDTSAQGS